MGREIERKFLVQGRPWEGVPGTPYRQGYLASGYGVTVRVRLAGDRAYLTVKGPTSGFSRDEYEYPIPPGDAASMLETLCGGRLVEKTRHLLVHAGRTWEVDVFVGANRGLVLAEVELESEDAAVELPPWAGAEVTGDYRYANAFLARRPFSTWGET